ncbi:MAG: hypothetical protein RBQ94_05705 [Methanimicrococcus sp.]|nr:hypothetical protein [Methanimicrococcus sp.]
MYRIIAVVVLSVAVATLQVYLCQRKNKKIGLILPALSFLVSISVIIGVYVYSDWPNLISLLLASLQIFIFINLLTAFLIFIYIYHHGRR